jgi:hypothetical protein
MLSRSADDAVEQPIQGHPRREEAEAQAKAAKSIEESPKS